MGKNLLIQNEDIPADSKLFGNFKSISKNQTNSKQTVACTVTSLFNVSHNKCHVS